MYNYNTYNKHFMKHSILTVLLSLIGIVAHSQEKQTKETYSEDEKLAIR